jgi:hypothetical protein
MAVPWESNIIQQLTRRARHARRAKNIFVKWDAMKASKANNITIIFFLVRGKLVEILAFFL